MLLTIIIKSVFYPLNHASARSMAKLKVIAPKLKALQEQYANDKQQLQIKMMEMYKQEKIYPLGGCLPMVTLMRAPLDFRVLAKPLYLLMPRPHDTATETAIDTTARHGGKGG